MNNLVRAAAALLSQSVGQSKKASSITHAHHTLVRTAAHNLLDNQRKLHQSITHDSNVHKQLLVRSSSALLVPSQVLVMCTAWNIRFELSKLILSAGFLPQKNFEYMFLLSISIIIMDIDKTRAPRRTKRTQGLVCFFLYF
jgi:hypothetical protein